MHHKFKVGEEVRVKGEIVAISPGGAVTVRFTTGSTAGDSGTEAARDQATTQDVVFQSTTSILD
jgi:hypothetical protein